MLLFVRAVGKQNVTALAQIEGMDGECSFVNVVGCAGAVMAAVMGCIGGVVTGPGDVVICTGGVLGAGSTCFECMCDVFDWLASHVLGGLCWAGAASDAEVGEKQMEQIIRKTTILL